jgi:AcrR family transcriptional regulator
VPGRRARKKLERKRRIFDAALALFLEKGYEATTVEEIAERADVGKGTVFNYFPHKRAFLSALAEEWLSQITAQLGPMESWKGSSRDQLKRVCRLTAEFSAEHRELARLVIFEAMREVHAGMREERPPDNAPLFSIESVAHDVIVRGQAAGEVRANLDTGVVASLIGAAVFDTLIRWLVRGGSVKRMQDSIEAKLDIIFAGLAP